MHPVELHIAKSRIVSESNAPLSEVQSYIIDSCLNRGDEAAAKVFINDWNQSRSRPIRDVSKWIPGEHFYALDKKFSSLDEAIGYLGENGFSFGTLRERFQYRESGG